VVLDLSSMEKRPYLSSDRDFVAAAIQRIFQVLAYIHARSHDTSVMWPPSTLAATHP
jgi:hypothetical protein